MLTDIDAQVLSRFLFSLFSKTFSPFINISNRVFSSRLLPLCENEFLCETIHMKMCFPYRFIFM